MEERDRPEKSLGRFEEKTLRLLKYVNENPRARALQEKFHHAVGTRWVSLCIDNLLHVEGLQSVAALDPPGGVILCANHRSFFDGYIISCTLFKNTPWCQRVRFPVRANFFYESLTGVAINMIVGGGSMYPPIFRDPKKAAFNKSAMDWLTDSLQERGTLVGMHPEGTRGKGPDPYELLPAQPGVGQVIARSGAMVLPVFINGLTNSFIEQVSGNYRGGAHRGEPVVVVFGDPVDLSSFAGQNPRPALYKRIADHVLNDIRKLGERERVVRAELLSRR